MNQFRSRALLALALVLSIAGCEQRPAESSSHSEPKFYVGIGTHITSTRGLDLTQAAGIPALREDIFWSRVEVEKGELAMPARYEDYVSAALNRGIQPLLILCYGNRHYDEGGFPTSEEAVDAFARFAEFVVSHFNGRVRSYEVWNEWNIGLSMPPGTGPGDAKTYVELLRRVYPRLKAIDPDALVLGGGIAGTGVQDDWLETACAAGLLEHLDGLSFHPYCYGAPGDERLPEHGFLNRVRDVQTVLRRHASDREIPLYITEIGWPNHTGESGSSVDDSARFLARTILLGRTIPSLKGVWWYDWRDDGLDPADREHNFGIVSHNLTPKPAWFAMRDLCRLFEETRFDTAVETPAGTHGLRFVDHGGLDVLVLWSLDANERWEAVVSTPGKPAVDASLRLLGREAIAIPWVETGEGSWEVRLSLSPDPCFLKTGVRAARVTVVRPGGP